ncbi:hypothetical protein ALP10_04778 [Pseudomonas syringae pv. helianthi]|uniref:Uncharacterized protein n=1 Tax=Pseudomonas syringae pv. helianthi TaxID=251654 RepID=A0A3M6DAK4_9PSED|nr:hypothetical protein ALP10_04778 [Pseudomonas syringae pv. helianthi]
MQASTVALRVQVARSAEGLGGDAIKCVLMSSAIKPVETRFMKIPSPKP